MGTATKKTIEQLVSENREYFQMAISVACVIRKSTGNRNA